MYKDEKLQERQDNYRKSTLNYIIYKYFTII